MKIETSVARHRKFVVAGPAAAWLWVCGLSYAKEGLTDGFIPTEAIDYLGVKGARKLAVALVDAGLWHATDGGWSIHDYLQHNHSAEQVETIKQKRADGGKQGGRPKRDSENLHETSKVSAPNLTRFPTQNLIENPETETEEETEEERRRGDRRAAERRTALDDVQAEGKPHPIRDLLGFYQQRYTQVFGAKPVIAGDRDSGILARLLRQADETALRAALDAMFSDEWAVSQGCAITLFSSQINRFLGKSRAPKPPAAGTEVRTQPSKSAAAAMRRAGLLS